MTTATLDKRIATLEAIQSAKQRSALELSDFYMAIEYMRKHGENCDPPPDERMRQARHTVHRLDAFYQNRP